MNKRLEGRVPYLAMGCGLESGGNRGGIMSGYLFYDTRFCDFWDTKTKAWLFDPSDCTPYASKDAADDTLYSSARVVTIEEARALFIARNL